MRLAIEMSMSAVATEVGESDTTLWRVFSNYVDRAIRDQLNLSNVRRIGVDETANKRGHNYVTIFMDIPEHIDPSVGCIISVLSSLD